MKIWIVVADERQAFFYDAQGAKGPFDLVLKIVNPSGRPDRELESDRPGRGFSSSTGQRHGLDGERSSKRTGQQDFARRISDEIERGRNGLRFEKLMLVSGPRTLGSIRAALSDPSRAMLAAEVTKDLANLGEAGLPGRLPELLRESSQRPH